jgi:Zn-dependent protease
MSDWMSDPMTWAVPAGRYFGIRVRIHILFILLAVPQVLHGLLFEGAGGFAWALGWNAILFFSVLFHEFGHCFAARAVGGDAEEILMWPLGGLAFVSVPNTARAHFISTVWGPLVNVILCVATAAVLLVRGHMPPLNPFDPFGAELFELGLSSWLMWVGVAFVVNWLLLLFNLVPAFPMDAGRMLRCGLWVRIGFRQATMITVQVAKVCAIAMGIVGFIMMLGDSKPAGLQLVCIALFVYIMSDRERRMLEAGMLVDDSVFGYDFSQGYTSLASSQPKSKPKRISAWERWRRRRERLKRQRELAAKQEEERKVDEILAKLHREGMASLTDQERRFLTRTSEKYRSRNRTD